MRDGEISRLQRLIAFQNVRQSLLLLHEAANVFASVISKRPEKRKKLCNQIHEVSSSLFEEREPRASA